MRSCSFLAGAIILLTASAAVVTAEESPAETATGRLVVEPVDFDGQPLAENSISLWRQVSESKSSQDRWHDPLTDTQWECLRAFATSGSSTFDQLNFGTYRVRVRAGHGSAGAFGVSDPIVIDADHLQESTKVSLIIGGTLRVECLDNETGQPIPPPHLQLTPTSDSMWQRYQFAAEPVPGERGQFQYAHLPPGEYRLSAARSAQHPEDVKFELVGVPLKIAMTGEIVVTRELRFRKSSLTKEEIARNWPWVVYGRVTDGNGQPVAGAIIRAFSGIATLFQTGAAETDEDGRYRLHFRTGAMIEDGGFNLLPALVSASKPGMYEHNLNQQGELAMANRQPPELPEWLADRPLVLPKEPREINFKLTPHGSLRVSIASTNRNKLKDLHVSLKGSNMPPGSSVIDSGRADRWGDMTFAEVPLDHDWWIEIALRDRRSVRTQPFRITASQRYSIELELHTDSTGIDVLDVVSLTDALGRDRTLALVGDDPIAHAPASPANQRQARQWLRQIAHVNCLWLSPPPAEVAEYGYNFHIVDESPRRYEVPRDRGVPGVTFHGIAFVSAVKCLTDDPENVVVRRISRADNLLSFSYTLRQPAKVSAGNGVLGSYRGFVSRSLHGGALSFDPRTFQVIEHIDGDHIERYSDYVRPTEGHCVPRTVEILESGKPRFRWSFAIYEPGLWLLNQSLACGDGEADGLVRIDNVEINGAAPTLWRSTEN